MRQNEPALRVGRYRPGGVRGNAFAFFREYGETRLLIAANLGHDERILTLPRHLQIEGHAVMSTHSERVGRAVTSEIRIAGDEGMIVMVH